VLAPKEIEKTFYNNHIEMSASLGSVPAKRSSSKDAKQF
jgi:hypothetical protein